MFFTLTPNVFEHLFHATESLRQGKKLYLCCSFPTWKVKWKGFRLPILSPKLTPHSPSPSNTHSHTHRMDPQHSGSHCTALRTTESPAGRVTRQQFTRQQYHPLVKIKPRGRLMLKCFFTSNNSYVCHFLLLLGKCLSREIRSLERMELVCERGIRRRDKSKQHLDLL